MKIEKIEDCKIIQDKIDETFVEQAQKNNINTNYQEFVYSVKDDNGIIMGGISGRRLFKEVHVSELCLAETARGQGIGKKLLEIVEKEICNSETDYITLTTNAFQKAIEFYKKCGFEIEFIRKNKDSRFDKYYMVKNIYENRKS